MDSRRGRGAAGAEGDDGHPIDPFLDAWFGAQGGDNLERRLRVYRGLSLGGNWSRERLRRVLRSLLTHDAASVSRFNREFEVFFPGGEAPEWLEARLRSRKGWRPDRVLDALYEAGRRQPKALLAAWPVEEPPGAPVERPETSLEAGPGRVARDGSPVRWRGRSRPLLIAGVVGTAVLLWIGSDLPGMLSRWFAEAPAPVAVSLPRAVPPDRVRVLMPTISWRSEAAPLYTGGQILLLGGTAALELVLAAWIAARVRRRWGASRPAAPGLSIRSRLHWLIGLGAAGSLGAVIWGASYWLTRLNLLSGDFFRDVPTAERNFLLRTNLISAYAADVSLLLAPGLLLVLVIAQLMPRRHRPRAEALSPLPAFREDSESELELPSGLPWEPYSRHELDRLAYLTGISPDPEHLELDVARTVNTTVQQGGMLSVRYRVIRRPTAVRIVLCAGWEDDEVARRSIECLAAGLKARGLTVHLVRTRPPAEAGALTLLLLNGDREQPARLERVMPRTALVEIRERGLWGPEMNDLPCQVFTLEFSELCEAVRVAAGDLRPPAPAERFVNRSSLSRLEALLPLSAAASLASAYGACPLDALMELRGRLRLETPLHGLQRLARLMIEVSPDEAEAGTPASGLVRLARVVADESGWRFDSALTGVLLDSPSLSLELKKETLCWQRERIQRAAPPEASLAAAVRELYLAHLEVLLGCLDEQPEHHLRQCLARLLAASRDDTLNRLLQEHNKRKLTYGPVRAWLNGRRVRRGTLEMLVQLGLAPEETLRGQRLRPEPWAALKRIGWQPVTAALGLVSVGAGVWIVLAPPLPHVRVEASGPVAHLILSPVIDGEQSSRALDVHTFQLLMDTVPLRVLVISAGGIIDRMKSLEPGTHYTLTVGVGQKVVPRQESISVLGEERVILRSPEAARRPAGAAQAPFWLSVAAMPDTARYRVVRDRLIQQRAVDFVLLGAAAPMPEHFYCAGGAAGCMQLWAVEESEALAGDLFTEAWQERTGFHLPELGGREAGIE